MMHMRKLCGMALTSKRGAWISVVYPGRAIPRSKVDQFVEME